MRAKADSLLGRSVTTESGRKSDAVAKPFLVDGMNGWRPEKRDALPAEKEHTEKRRKLEEQTHNWPAESLAHQETSLADGTLDTKVLPLSDQI